MLLIDLSPSSRLPPRPYPYHGEDLRLSLQDLTFLLLVRSSRIVYLSIILAQQTLRLTTPISLRCAYHLHSLHFINWQTLHSETLLEKGSYSTIVSSRLDYPSVHRHLAPTQPTQTTPVFTSTALRASFIIFLCTSYQHTNTTHTLL